MKPSLPKGTRDFLPEQVLRRQHIFNTILEAYERFGFLPIETPAIENLQTLTGKYGDEGDQLLFKVLNNGDFLSKVSDEQWAQRDAKGLLPQIAKRGLRYDLTVPFARYVAMHRNDISMPFRRYQIQPVWRGDRPQKGRYQEFVQCDADIIGTDSLMCEAELLLLLDQVFDALGLEVIIRLNHRRLLQGLAHAAGLQDQFVAMAVAIDKLDKIGADKVIEELSHITTDTVDLQLLTDVLRQPNFEQLRLQLSEQELAQEGIAEVDLVMTYIEQAGGLKNELVLDPTLARGLTYYTGCIIEVVGVDSNLGSLAGGGRYDDLTAMFGMANVSGVGVSFGAARIYDLMEEQGLFDETISQTGQLMIAAFDQATHQYAFGCLQKLRQAGVNAELYPEPAKIKKQMKYADARHFTYVLLIGEEEMQSGLLSLKNMKNGSQQKYNLQDIIGQLSSEN